MITESTPVRVGGTFTVRCLAPDGTVRWSDTAKNGVTNLGLNKILDVMFHGTTPITTWYIGLIDNSGFSALAAADTLASHAGWTELTGYSGNRKEWTEGAASSQSTTNATSVDFVASGSGTVYGVFLAEVASGTSGLLWATAALSGGTQALTSGDTLQVTYTVTAS